MTRNFKVKYNPRIYLDIQKAVNYYKEQTQSDVLSRRFFEAVEKALKKLGNSALHHQVRYNNIRILSIPSFPYKAHYWVDEESKVVFVEAIFHSRENPEEWRTKTGK